MTLKLPVFFVLALPLAWLLWQVASEIQVPGSALGADPGEAVVLFLGEWAIRGLLLTLAVSTLRRLLRLPVLARLRRMVGLWAFTYVVLHFVAYLGLLAGFDVQTIGSDVFERPYITVGFSALLLLVPLAVTSTHRWQRRLGKRWKTLHRGVYAAPTLALLHLLWLTKDGYLDVVLYALVFALLLAERVHARRRSPATVA